MKYRVDFLLMKRALKWLGILLLLLARDERFGWNFSASVFAPEMD